MGKSTICIGENKDADQLRGNREADQRLCFRYSDSTIPPLLNSKISSFKPAPVAVQAGLCQTCSETTLSVFPRGGSILYLNHVNKMQDVKKEITPSNLHSVCIVSCIISMIVQSSRLGQQSFTHVWAGSQFHMYLIKHVGGYVLMVKGPI